MDHVSFDHKQVFRSDVPKEGTGGVGETQADTEWKVASAKAKGLSETCRKYVFTKPFSKETLGKDLETKHKVFNVFFVTVGVLTFPAMLPMSAAALAYVAHMEAKNMKKGQASIDASLRSCEKMGITIPETLKERIEAHKNWDNSKHFIDKPFIKESNEIIKELNGLHKAKRNEMGEELRGLVGICRHKEVAQGMRENLKFEGSLSLSQETKDILCKEKTSMEEEFNAINELKGKMNDIPGLKEAMANLEAKLEASRNKPIPSLDIQPLTENEVADFPSTGNAMQDFIQCGAGFEAKEVTVGDVTQKVKVKNEQINAQTIALSLGVFYKLHVTNKNLETNKDVEVTHNDGREFTDLKNWMSDANSKLDTNNKSAQGDLAQMDRILDVTIAACESNLYKPSINADLDKQGESKIRGILTLAENVPELKAKAEKLKILINSSNDPVNEISMPNSEETNSFNNKLDSVRNGDLNSKERSELAQDMAQDSRDIHISLIKKMDFQLMESTGKASDDFVQYTNNLTNFIIEDILKAKTPKQFRNSVDFYLEFATAATEKGDFMTASDILSALSSGPISKLTTPPGDPEKPQIISVKLKKDIDERLENLKTLCSDSKNYAEMGKRINNFEGVAIPIFAKAAKAMTTIGEISKSIDTDSGKIPNLQKNVMVSSIFKPYVEISRLNGGEAKSLPGFSSIVGHKFINKDGEVMDTEFRIANGLDQKARELKGKMDAIPERKKDFSVTMPSNPFKSKSKTDADVEANTNSKTTFKPKKTQDDSGIKFTNESNRKKETEQGKKSAPNSEKPRPKTEWI